MIELPLPQRWRERALVIRDVIDPESWLREDELAVVRSFKLEKRRREWMLARIAAKELARRLALTNDPRAFAVERPLVSISHSGPYAGAAIGAGIDIEVVRHVDERVARHFLTDDEVIQLQRCATNHRILHFWCAKEAAWKARGGATALLKDVRVTLIEESEEGVRFDVAETVAFGELVVALTRPTS